MKQHQRIALLLGVASALTLAGCGGAQTSATSTASATSVPGVASAKATLTHVPSGTADLTWTQSDKSLQAQITLIGLAPNSSHAARIHTGSCAQQGNVLYALPNITADASGKATLTHTIQNVAGGLPANGWYLNVHDGTGDDAYSKLDIACVDIHNIDKSTAGKETARLTFARGMAPSQNASGSAQLHIESGKLVVTVHVSGLEPGSTHPEHIHTGSCANQGAIVHPLANLIADGSGSATVTTTIASVSSIPSSGWYVNVHRGVNLNSPIDFDPIACGDVTPA